MDKKNIRYYKGKQKLLKKSGSDSMHKCLYLVIELGELIFGSKQVIPHRLCWRKRKN